VIDLQSQGLGYTSSQPACIFRASLPARAASFEDFEPAWLLEQRPSKSSDLLRRAATFEDFEPACLLGQRPSKPTTEQLRASPSINMAAQYQHGSDTFSFVALGEASPPSLCLAKFKQLHRS